jgi:UDP-glucose 4-epimerase
MTDRMANLDGQRFCIVGGAGFIGSHFTDALLAHPEVAKVTLYDNFSSGREWHYAQHASDRRLRVVRGNVEQLDELRQALDGHDVVIHLASNPDIARAATEPSIDFWQGTALTHNVVEAMRTTSAKRILYASGSGVYGELGTHEAAEDHGPLVPVSTYGASKLAGEALIASYAYMFGLSGCAFRFGNVVGPRQTHGVGFDFARRLLLEPAAEPGRRVPLRILGDGSQSKSYIHVSDVVRAVLTAHAQSTQPFAVYNVATGDYITVTEIARIAVACLGLSPEQVDFQYTGGDRGWKGDVPVVRLNTQRIMTTGWRCERTSAEALRQSILAMLPDLKAGRM